MAISPNVLSTESLYNNDLVSFNDISTGSDVTLTVRHITIQLDDGSYLVPNGTSTNYIVWPYANPSITVDILEKSTAATVLYEWFADPTQPALYTLTQYLVWDLYDYLFLFGLLSIRTSAPLNIADNGFLNQLQMIVNLFQAENAITKMSDVYSSQLALNDNQVFIDNQNDYF